MAHPTLQAVVNSVSIASTVAGVNPQPHRLLEEFNKLAQDYVGLVNRVIWLTLQTSAEFIETPLKEERFPPLELPAQSNLYYFRLLRGESARSWQQIQSEKSAVVRWSGNESADYDLTLYMTLPKSET